MIMIKTMKMIFFVQIVYSKRSMFKTVPITVKTTDDAPNNLGNDEESGIVILTFFDLL